MNNNEGKLFIFGLVVGGLSGASMVLGYITYQNTMQGTTSESKEFIGIGKRMLTWIANYRINVIKTLPVVSKVEPNYLSKLISNVAPESPESWDSIFRDLDTAIVVSSNILSLILFLISYLIDDCLYSLF